MKELVLRWWYLLFWQHRWYWGAASALAVPLTLDVASPEDGMKWLRASSVVIQFVGAGLAFRGILQLRNMFPRFAQKTMSISAEWNIARARVWVWLSEPVGGTPREPQHHVVDISGSVRMRVNATATLHNATPTPEELRAEFRAQIDALRSQLSASIAASQTALNDFASKTTTSVSTLEHAVAGGTNNQILGLVLLGIGGVLGTVEDEIHCLVHTRQLYCEPPCSCDSVSGSMPQAPPPQPSGGAYGTGAY